MNVFTKKFIFALVAIFLPFISSSQSIEVDGLSFVIDSENSIAFIKFVGDDFSSGGSYSGDIVIPSSVEYDGQSYSVIGIYPYTFYRCPNLTSVSIPETVAFIGHCAFMECTSLTSIVLPDAVEFLDTEALRGCTMLESAILPAYITGIPENTFYCCESLQSIDIPDSVESIGDYAFSQCYSLESVKMGASVKTVGSDAFASCNSLKSVYTPSLELWCNIQFSTSHSTPLYHSGDLYVNGVLLENLVDFPSSLSGVGDYSFYGCGSLKSVTIPEGHTSIGYASFANCYNLETVIIPSSVTNIGSEAFCYSGLKSIEIPASVSSIGDYSLTGCENLESIVISPENTVYDSRDNCNALIETATNTLICGCNTTVIPNTVTTLAAFSFYYSGLTSIEIPESIVSIPEEAFFYCSNLESVSIGSSVTSIDQTAFLYTDLKSITVDSENPVYDSRDNCNAIIISETNELFLGCETTVIPTTATSIVYPGFAENKGLTSVVIPSNITKIGANTFKRCYNVKSVEVENGVVTIEDGAFFANNTLESVILPASLTYIGRMAFGMIQTIQYIRCDAVTPPELGDFVFYWTDTNTCVLEVPDESVEAYKAAAQWGDFINTTGVAKVHRDENGVIVENGNILNADNANIEVYTISGAKIYSGKESRVTLPSGLYIIKSDGKAMKVAL